MRKFVFFCSVAAAWLLVGPMVQAQDIPPKIRELMAEKIGIPADAPDYTQRLNSLLKRPVTDDMMRLGFAKSYGVDPSEIDLKSILGKPADSHIESLVPQKLASKFYFGDGIALEKTLEEGNKPATNFKPANLDEEIARIDAQGQASVARYIETRAIPECAESNVVHDEAPPGIGDQDILVLSGKAPLDADQLYGRSTRVIEYKVGKTHDADSILVSLAEPECLPYRVRIIGGRRNIYYGRHALLNFDKDPEGSGDQAIKIKPVRSKKR